MKKVMVLGSTGMAGHVITKYLSQIPIYKVLNVSRSKLDEKTFIIDVNNKKTIKKLLFEKKPDIVVNCIGVLIKESERYPDHAIYINGFFPRYLERIGIKLRFKVINLSTDCVFSGKKGNYSENDLKDAEDIYGRSKALGEVINDKDLTFRTSFIGPALKVYCQGLFHWFMTQNDDVFGYTDVYWTGITTLELAKAIDQAIHQDLSGLYHLVPDKKISKYELLKLIKEIWKKPIKIFKKNVPISDKSLINTKTNFHYNIPDYQTMLKELFNWMNKVEYYSY